MNIRLVVSVPLVVGLLGLGACSSEEAIPTDIKVDSIEWSTCDEYPDDEMVECGVLEAQLTSRSMLQFELNSSLSLLAPVFTTKTTTAKSKPSRHLNLVEQFHLEAPFCSLLIPQAKTSAHRHK